jgi:hypothetical protein
MTSRKPSPRWWMSIMTSRADPELPCRLVVVQSRVNLNALLSGYIDSGVAIASSEL